MDPKPASLRKHGSVSVLRTGSPGRGEGSIILPPRGVAGLSVSTQRASTRYRLSADAPLVGSRVARHQLSCPYSCAYRHQAVTGRTWAVWNQGHSQEVLTAGSSPEGTDPDSQPQRQGAWRPCPNWCSGCGERSHRPHAHHGGRAGPQIRQPLCLCTRQQRQPATEGPCPALPVSRTGEGTGRGRVSAVCLSLLK